MKKYSLKERNEEKREVDYSVLNEQQKEVVFSDSKSSLVLAGPGSGKTKVLVYKIAKLIESGVKPGEIMLLTFTNKAAKEMIRRVEELLGGYPKGLIAGTFHHVGNMFLAKHGKEIGFNNFSIIDREDSRQLIKDIIARLFPDKDKHFPSARIIDSIISFSRNSMKPVSQCIRENYSAYLDYSAEINGVAESYRKRKKSSGLMDFDDLLYYWNELLDNRITREFYNKKFRYVFVDEFQDTNKLQFDVIKKIAKQNIMVVGDDFQSIYSFRAAEIKNILDFPKNFEDCKEYKLERNYRSTPEILELINQSISNNKSQFKKRLFTKNNNSEKPALVRCKDTEQEANFVCQRILEMKEEGDEYYDFGILFRADYHSAEVELEMMKRGIPFKKRGGLKFFEQAHIKDMTALLKIMNNHKDELAWKRILCLFDGIGPARAISVWNWVSNTRDPLKSIRSIDNQIFGNSPISGWSDFKKMISLIPLSKDPKEITQSFFEGFYASYLKDKYPNFREREMDVKQYINLASQYSDLRKFLEDTLLDADLTAADGENSDEGYVLLSTIHQAKGLEWKNVFVCSLSEERFPSTRSYEGDTIEEERRLFYVACSRAKKNLFLTAPMQEFTYWGGFKILRDSVFIEELPEECYEVWEIESEARDKIDSGELSFQTAYEMD